jgi:glycosyltransferase involved in cell wall biosynthesis
LLFAVFQTGSLANGGVESITAVIEGLRDWPRLIVTNRETPVCARWRESGAEVVVWDLPYEMGSSVRAGGLSGKMQRAWSLVKTNLQVAAWALRGRMTVIHCNDPAPFWHLAPAAKLRGIPLVFNLRDTKSAEEGLEVAKYRRRFRLTARVLVISQEMKQFYRAVSNSTAIENIYSSVNFERMRPLDAASRAALRKRLGIAPETFAIGYIAAFNDKKNQLGYLREAVPALHRANPNARTYFVGDFAPAKDAYARECEQLASDATQFVGFTPAVEDWYQACDVIVVPTRKEGLARCMVEGLACGTPVVSFDVSSAREILEQHECGLVVKSDDYPALVRAIQLLATNAATMTQMQSRAAAIARKLFASDRMIREYEALYTSLGKGTR